MRSFLSGSLLILSLFSNSIFAQKAAPKPAVSAAAAAAPKRADYAIPFVNKTLANGFEVIVLPDPSVPIVTVDRKINATACKDYVSFIASDFVEQGRRAADQMIEATGGKGEVAILLGSAGNNVTTERTKGFKERIAEKAPDLKVVFEQTGDFAREKGQQVTEQLVQSKPGIKGIYVRSYKFDADFAYPKTDVDMVRKQLSAPGWQRLVEVRSRKEQQNVDIDILVEQEKANGLAIIASQPREFTIVNIVGSIDMRKLHQIEGQFGIPKLELEEKK